MWRLAASLMLVGTMAAPAAAAPVEWDCDTPGGAFSELAQVQGGPAYHVRGTVSWQRSHADSRYLPSAQVRIENGDRSRSIAVRLVLAPRAERIESSVESRNGGEPQRRTVGTAASEEAVPFEIEVAASGQAIVTLGGERVTLQVDLGPGARIAATCSTGEFLFRTLDFGG
jgi:hypothetical protein